MLPWLINTGSSVVLPYGGMTRIRFKGFISLATTKTGRDQTPSNGVKVLEKQDKSKVLRPFGPYHNGMASCLEAPVRSVDELLTQAVRLRKRQLMIEQ